MDTLDIETPARSPVLPLMEAADMRLDVALWQAGTAAANRHLVLGDDPELATIRAALKTASDAFCRLRAKTYGVPV